MRLASAVGLVFAGAVVCVDAQWLSHRDTSIPRTADGRPNLAAPAPRSNGKPDLTGLWQAERTPVNEFVRVLGPGLPQIQPDLNDVTKHVINVLWDVNPGDQVVRPEAAALMQERQKSGRDFQSAYCLPTSLPAAMLVLNFKMIQAPGEIVVIPGNGDPVRQIYMDGRSLPKDPEPSWMGSSVGRWDGVAMRVTERYRRRDFGHMDVEMNFDDPKYYTKPFGFKTTLTLIPDSDVLEYVCTENEKDRVHYKN
jgi:hypothetical protein